MQVTKLTAADAEALAEYKRTKAPLGVIHPVHAKVKQGSDDEDFSDLVITAKPLKPVKRSDSKPDLPNHLVSPVFKTKTPKKLQVKPPWGRRASPKKSGKIKTLKQEKELKNVSLNILRAIPEFINTIAKKKKLSLLKGKDLTTSTREYKQKIARLLTTNKGQERTKLADDQEHAVQLLNTNFTKLQLSQDEYTKIKAEVDELRRMYDQQIWKEKIVSRFLADHTEGDLDIKSLKRLLSQRQLRQEHTFLAMQKFCVNLKDYAMQKDGLSYVVGVNMSDLSSFLRSYTPGLSETERDQVIFFIEQVKLSITDPHQEGLPLQTIEGTLERLFLTWDQEKSMIEAFIDDVTQAFCYEQNIGFDAVLNSDRSRTSKQLELRIVAEFISQYFDRLSNSMKKKAQTLEQIIYRLTYGKEMPGRWKDMIKSAKEEANTKQTTAQVSGAPQLRPESAKPASPQKQTLTTKGLLKRPESAKVGAPAAKLPSYMQPPPSKAHAPPNQTSKSPTSNLAVSRKNPLDSLTSLNESLDKDLDDFISVLNAKKPEASESPKASPRNTPDLQQPSKMLIGRYPAQSTHQNLASPKRSNSPEYRGPNRYTKHEEPAKAFAPFASIDGPLRESTSERIETYKARLVQLEAQQIHAKETDDHGMRLSRADLLKKGAVKFSPYLDIEGRVFDPSDKFKNMDKPRAKETDIDPLYLFEMTQKKPERDEDWFIRPHHLQSVTKHPFSINDDPLVVRKKDNYSITRPPVVQDEDSREQAVNYLEGALEDLKYELEERRRALKTKVYTTEADAPEARFTGWVAKAAEAFQ